MNIGAIAVLDALGFKGIWERQDPRAVLQRLKSLRRHGKRLQGLDRGGVLLTDSGFSHRVRCMSDTIVVTVMLKGPRAPKRMLYRAMLSASIIAGQIIFDALYGSPPLLFRGCLAAGEMNEDVDFLIGPSVDEAAERCELADGGFFWLAPSALDVTAKYADTFADRLEPNIMVPYAVPMKNGQHIDTQSFTFFEMTRPLDGTPRLSEKLCESFGDGCSQSVERKKSHTLKFVEHVQSLRASGELTRGCRSIRRPDWKDLSSAQRMKILRLGVSWAEEP